MADELWIVSDSESAGWCVTADGKVEPNDDYPLGGARVAIAVPDAPLTKKQATAIRKLIAKLRKDGVLENAPKRGVQYPNDTTVGNVKQSMGYLHCWTDDCDEDLHTLADLGVGDGLPWIEPEAVEPPDQSVHQDGVAAHAELSKARDERVAREEAEELSITYEKPAAGEEQALPHGGGEEEDVSGQVQLDVGMEGMEVQAWQGVVNEVLDQYSADHDHDLITADGVFGKETQRATRVAQALLGVPVSGKVDGATWTAIL